MHIVPKESIQQYGPSHQAQAWKAGGPFLPCTVLLLYEGLQWRQNPLEETDPRCPSPGTCHGLPWLSSQFLCESGQTPAPKENWGIAKACAFSSSSHSTRAPTAGSRGCSTLTGSHDLERADRKKKKKKNACWIGKRSNKANATQREAGYGDST